MLDFPSILNNLVSEFLWVLLVAAYFLLPRILRKYLRPDIVSFRWQIYFGFFASCLAISLWAAHVAKGPIEIGSWISPLLIAMAGFAFLWWNLRGFDVAEVNAAFPTTKEGIGYSRSLRLVHKSLDFMGIGASKLTKDPEFMKAMDRCTDITAQGPTVRLLLASPEHPIIGKTERVNRVVNDEYKRNLTDSLREIARISNGKDKTIEVRHYNDELVREYPQFRLMFIDGEFCLFSWNVWDGGKGVNNPQFILRRGAKDKEASALYKSYKKYFDDIWELSTKVDLGPLNL